MTPIPITPYDLGVLLFGSTAERNKHTDEANYHWLRRTGAPAMDMPHKIISPHLAAEIAKADPAGTFLHIQVVSTPTITYHVLWETRHWMESNERRHQRFYEALRAREEYFAVKSETLARDTAHANRMSHMISAIIACGVPRTNARVYVETAWRDAANEEAFKTRILSIENLFNITGIYQPPYEPQENQDQDTQAAEPGAHREPTGPADGDAGQAGPAAGQADDEDRAAARDGGGADPRAGTDGDRGSDADSTAASGQADSISDEQPA
jgi:hypothetical protein